MPCCTKIAVSGCPMRFALREKRVSPAVFVVIRPKAGAE